MSVQENQRPKRKRLPADQRLLNADEVAARLDCSPEWVRRASRADKNPLPAVRLGRAVRYDWSQVAGWFGIGGPKAAA